MMPGAAASADDQPDLESRLAVAKENPLRARILASLRRGPAAPSELAPMFGEPLHIVARHARRLEALGLALRIDDDRIPGERKKKYRLSDELIARKLAEEDLESRTSDGVIVTLHDVLERSDVAVIASTISGSTRHRLVARPATLDDQGWRAIARVLRQAALATREIEKQSARRAAAAGPPIPTRDGIICIESQI